MVLENLDSELLVMCMIKDIVIPPDQEKPDVGMTSYPHTECVPFNIVPAVEQITKEQNDSGLPIQDQLVQSFQVGLSDLSGDSNP